MSSDPFAVLLQSNQVSQSTRTALEERLALPEDYEPRYLSPKEFGLLKALTEIVLPQRHDLSPIPVAAQIDLRLSQGDGSGWRYAVLPSDPEAHKAALRLLEELLVGQTDAAVPATDSRLRNFLIEVESGEHDRADFALSRWFEGFKVDVIRYWLADPRTMQLLNYDGFADNLKTPQDVSDESRT